jgi:hypothetical protein
MSTGPPKGGPYRSGRGAPWRARGSLMLRVLRVLRVAAL